ncbi:endolytic transglycosylase MltG [Helicovermis profundi]|uniref:Endolytic murein transglycosylase n=1 Tax=Helicovermis profundi TaxID=3065157 RepID=A0AAU9EV47_9FIRM|nr:endolytic transglycosylase MltG [Clostridia bacterium S502]
MKNIKFIILVLVLSVSLLGCNPLDSFNKAVDSNDSKTLIVIVSKGASTNKIANILKERDLIQNVTSFKLLSKKLNADGKMQAGKYKLSRSMDSSEIIEKMVNGDVFIETVRFTIPEGFNNKQIIQELVKDNLIDEERFIDVLKNYDFKYKFLEGINRKYMLEGFLFPDTYEVKVGASEVEIINIMLSKFDKVFKKEYYKQIEKRNMSVNQIVTLASIIEREAKLNEEKKEISGIFYNRLKKGMKLQSCATIQYALGEVKPVLYDKDLEIDSPFNTYKNVGLPPSPIASAGVDSIEAAIYPLDTKNLYFNTSNLGDGSHYFSKTYKEHLKNIKKSKVNSN